MTQSCYNQNSLHVSDKSNGHLLVRAAIAVQNKKHQRDKYRSLLQILMQQAPAFLLTLPFEHIFRSIVQGYDYSIVIENNNLCLYAKTL